MTYYTVEIRSDGETVMIGRTPGLDTALLTVHTNLKHYGGLVKPVRNVKHRWVGYVDGHTIAIQVTQA